MTYVASWGSGMGALGRSDYGFEAAHEDFNDQGQGCVWCRRGFVFRYQTEEGLPFDMY